MLNRFHQSTTRGQRVRIACALMGVFSVVFAVPSAMILGIAGKWLLSEDTSVITVSVTPVTLTASLCILSVAAAVVWALAVFIKRNDHPGPDGWGRPIISRSEAVAHTDLVWAIRRVWETEYIQEGQTVHFTTLRDVLGHTGIKVTATQIRSELQMRGCEASRESVKEGELRRLFERMGDEPETETTEITEAGNDK